MSTTPSAALAATDTNLWVRYLTNDDREQARRALEWFERQPKLWVPTTVLLELAWVLRAAYGQPRHAIEAGLRQVAGLPMVELQDPDAVAKALDWYHEGLDFADALHAASCPPGARLHSFDRDLVVRGVAMGAPVAALP
jgi:predicted nucleic-acid-binding protein